MFLLFVFLLSGFSGADMASLCREAALGPIRAITDIQNINADDVSVEYVTFFLHFNKIRTVSYGKKFEKYQKFKFLKV